MAFLIEAWRRLARVWGRYTDETSDNAPASSPTLPARRRPQDLRLPEGPDRFVNILIQVVERHVVHKMIESQAQELRNSADSIQTQFDRSMAWRAALQGRELPEIQGAIDDSEDRRADLLRLMNTQWRDEQGRSFKLGLKDLQVAAEADLRLAVSFRQSAFQQLYDNADEALRSSLGSNRVGGLPTDWRFCEALATLAASAKKLQDSEQQVSNLARATAERAALSEACGELVAARAAKDPQRLDAATVQVRNARVQLCNSVKSHRDLRVDLDRRRRNQRLDEDDFVEGIAQPLLVGEGHLLSSSSPSLPPTPSSLGRLSSAEENEPREPDAQGGDDDNAEVVATWKDARRDLADSQKQHETLLKFHPIILADHLATYSSGTLETAERDYEQRIGDTFTNREPLFRTDVEAAQARFEAAREGAVAVGVDMLPGSPAVFADMTTDGHSGSANSDWREARANLAPIVQRRVLWWSRTVARGTSPQSPQASPGWSPGGVDLTRPVDDDLEDDPSDAALIAWNLGKLEGLRPIAERKRSEAQIGPSRETRGQKRQRLGDNTLIQWQRTHPAQSDESVAKERRVQRRAVRAGRDNRSVGSAPDGQDNDVDSSTNSEPRDGGAS